MTPQEAVAQFHKAFGLPVLGSPSVPSTDRIDLRAVLLGEEEEEVLFELEELRDGEDRLTELAKELADLLYVTYGCALEFGIDLDAVFAKVHASNMSKLGEDGQAVRRDDGKILKGPNYRPVDYDTLLED